MTELDLLQLNGPAFKEKVMVADGHGLYDPEHYDDVGFPEGFVPVERHYSGKHYKEKIFRNGMPVEHMDGVYHLILLEKIVQTLELEFPSARGRGFQAQRCVDAIKRHLDKLEYELTDPDPRETPEEHMDEEVQA